MSLLPLMLNLQDKTVLLVGGGSTARAKLHALLETGARIRAVARRFHPGFPEETSRLQKEERPFQDADLEDVHLVISATDDTTVNAHVAQLARARNLLVVAVDDPPHCDAYFTSVLHRGPWTLALSTEGRFPGLSRALREVLDELIPLEDERLLSQLLDLRQHLKTRLPSPTQRSQALKHLLQEFRQHYLLPEVPRA